MTLTRTPHSHFRKYLQSGIWSLADQAVLALGFFLLNVLVARALGQSEFGTYSLLNGTITLSVTIVGALVGYPLTLRAAKLAEDPYKDVLSVSLTLSILSAGIAIPIIALLAGYLSVPGLLPILVASLFARTLQGVQRVGFVCRMQFAQVLVGDLISSLGPVAALLALIYFDVINIGLVFVSLFVTNLVSFFVQALMSRTLPSSLLVALKQAGGFWAIGKWSALNKYVTTGATLQLIPWTIGVVSGTASVAVYQAVSNVSNLISPIANGISIQLLPRVIRAGADKGVKVSVRLGLFGLVLMAPFALTLFVVPDLILGLVYGADSPYQGVGGLVRLFTLLVLIRYLATIVDTYMQGIGQAKKASVGAVMSFITGCLLAIPLVVLADAAGAIVSMIVIVFVRVALNFRSLKGTLGSA